MTEAATVMVRNTASHNITLTEITQRREITIKDEKTIMPVEQRQHVLERAQGEFDGITEVPMDIVNEQIKSNPAVAEWFERGKVGKRGLSIVTPGQDIDQDIDWIDKQGAEPPRTDTNNKPPQEPDRQTRLTTRKKSKD